jgi:hypothetical protein
MKSFKFTQFGTFTVAVLLPLMVFIFSLLIFSAETDLTFVAVMSSLILILIICLLIFYKLTIYIDDSNVAFSLGVGLIRKKYPLSQIEYCKPVKNSALYGIGIRLTPEGWLYNVSGLYAIELGFKNRKKIRIGTDKPEEVAQVINKLLNKSGSGFTFESSHRSYAFFVVMVIILGLIMPVVLFISGSKETELEYYDSHFRINGIYGTSINYSEIIRIDTLNSLPGIKMKTNGYAFGKVLKGHFRLYDQSKVKLFLRKGIPPYIHIITREEDIYLNFQTSGSAREAFKKIKSRIER